ncbi:MAG TPA: prepilin-type N-terminal cleavage/methylation domain-containing protein [Candidatus Ozemobacteraceae bacterium]|nr:prepilin-type N-terminal cleavage/methylation domain-containing protein [Candidatus Ozemobacteraceae bacterium]
MKRKSRSLHGFTLVELLMGMALTVLVGGVLYLLQTTGLSTASRGTVRLTLQSEMRRKMERLVNDLRCANEVLEVGPGRLRIARFRVGEEDEDLTGDAALTTVEYELEPKGGKWALYRAERGEQPVEIFSAEQIEPELFFPYYEQLPAEEGGPCTFEPFDMKSNDSDQRKRISFMRIRMRAKQNREQLSLTTSVTLRTAHSRIMQPGWKFR